MKTIIFFLLLTLTVAADSTAQFNRAKVTPQLAGILDTQPEGGKTRVIIHLSDKVDIEKFLTNSESLMLTQEEKTERLIILLREKAKNTQGSLLAYLRYNSMFGKAGEIKDFWIINAVAVYGGNELIKLLTFRSDIDYIESDNEIVFEESSAGSYTSQGINSVENGLKAIGADKLWKLGIIGTGTIVMNVDSGVDGTHPALNYKWRGLTVPWYHAWYDAAGTSFPTYCTDHGSHTMGIMCGLGISTGDTIGVSYGSTWIAARRSCSGNYTNFGIAAFQWGLDPDSNATTRDEASVINCSWNSSDPTGLECTGTFKSVLITLEAGGVPVVWSAGNSGPGASTITSPKNINTNEVNAFTVGAVDGNNPSYPIASFSSRGPSTCGGTGSLLIKPEVSAPGVNVRSSLINPNYGLNSGTSMAAPHASGSVALLRSFAPRITGKMALLALYHSASDLGTTGEDNTYGMGMINVFQAMKILGMTITHTPIGDTINLSGPYRVRVILNKSAITNAKPDTTKIKVFWSRNSINITDSIPMTRDTGNVWFANIPGNGLPAAYRYFIRLFDTLGVRAQNPADAPFTKFMFNAGATGITEPLQGVPDNYFLEQNYPNPFNPSTRIKFGLKESGTVKLTIFDISGRTVSVFLNAEMKAGIYEYRFDAGSFASGVYFYRLETAMYSETKKMLLLK